MKNNIKYLYLFVFSFAVASCGGGGGGGDNPDPPTPTVNRAPSTPTLSAPTNNLLCIDNTVQFQWNASTDPDNDPISYELQIATNNTFTANLQTTTVSTSSTSVTLDRGVAYYWRVRAKDSKNATSSYSSVYSFYTEGDGISNYLPFAPQLVKPTFDQVVTETSTELQWQASDVDNDPLTFDVYFDTVNPPTTIISNDQSGTAINVNLDATTNYYWKVVVKDGKSGETIGQVWRFKTD